VPGRGSFWPLFDLVVRTPRIELRLPSDDDFAGLIEVIDRGVHDPSTMPFSVPWTDAEPGERAKSAAQHWWGLRAGWSPDDWNFNSAVFVGGRPVGIQGMIARNFAVVRSVESASWLGREHQGLGLGREMREAMLHLAFAGLGAEEALSGAFEDNVSSLATSRAVGYAENGETRARRRNEAGRTLLFRMDRTTWERHRRNDIEIVGLEPCLEMFVGSPPMPSVERFQ
jgi:RimJ/RimL family protein N-acetyltransferase